MPSERISLEQAGQPLTKHANHRILLSGGQGDARPTARGRSPVANAKIISIVDHEINSAIEPLRQDIAAARNQIIHDLSFITRNLRHEINSLAAAVNKLRKDISQLELEKSDIYNSLAERQRDINKLRADVDQLKQGGEGPSTSA